MASLIIYFTQPCKLDVAEVHQKEDAYYERGWACVALVAKGGWRLGGRGGEGRKAILQSFIQHLHHGTPVIF